MQSVCHEPIEHSKDSSDNSEDSFKQMPVEKQFEDNKSVNVINSVCAFRNRHKKSSNKTKTNEELNELIQKLFFVKMPDDFFEFWNFCVDNCPDDPQSNII